MEDDEKIYVDKISEETFDEIMSKLLESPRTVYTGKLVLVFDDNNEYLYINSAGFDVLVGGEPIKILDVVRDPNDFIGICEILPKRMCVSEPYDFADEGMGRISKLQPQHRHIKKKKKRK
jgi:hypothetical protein